MAYAPVPQSNTSGSSVLSHLQAYWLRRKALSVLRPNFRFYGLCEPDTIPLREGKTITWWRTTNMPAASTGVAEGIVSTSLSQAPTKTVSATLSQYADFISTSDILRDVDPAPHMELLADNMGFRAGLTLDNVTRAVIDAESGALRNPLATYCTVRDFRYSWFVLQGRNVLPRTNGMLDAVIHPYIAFDLVNDPSANGLADIFKYTDPAKAGSIKLADRDLVAEVANCRIVQSTNVKQTTGSPNKWRTYVVGREAIGVASLAGYEPSGNVVDPNKQQFKVMSKVFKDIEVANPTAQIGGIVSYNYLHSTKVLEGPTNIGGLYRYDMFDAPSSIVA